MRKIILMGLFAAILAACTASSAPAIAHEFVASQEKGVVQDKNIGKHVFESGLVTVECEEEHSFGVVQAKHATISNEEVVYAKCKALSLPAEVSQAKYEFKAEGTVTLKGEVTVKIPKESCEVKIPTAGNENLGTVTYTNNQQRGTIELKAAVTGISSTLSGTGTVCPKGSTSNGKYKGTSEVFDYLCLNVGLGNGSFQDPMCRSEQAGGKYELFKTIIYFI